MPGSGSVGSVGCFALHFDYSGAMEREPEAGATSIVWIRVSVQNAPAVLLQSKGHGYAQRKRSAFGLVRWAISIHSVWTTWARLLPAPR